MSKYRLLICILVFFLFLIGIAILWLTGRWCELLLPKYNILDHEAFGTYGDFVGGVFGTVLAGIAAYYAVQTYFKDKENAKTEKVQQEQDRQDSDTNKQKRKIESHFYIMLEKHKEYSYFLIEGEEDYFSKNIKYLEEILKCCKKELNIIDSKSKVLSLSYLYFFYGSYLHSDIMPNKSNVINRMNKFYQDNNIQFEGASKKLGVYFRQLYQIVTYVNEKEILSYEEKYDYIKSLRVTLSNEEQYLLFLNSLSTLGRFWELGVSKNEDMITKFNLIKNIPYNFSRILGELDFEVNYPNILYEYKNDEVTKKRREEWIKDYT